MNIKVEENKSNLTIAQILSRKNQNKASGGEVLEDYEDRLPVTISSPRGL